MFLLFSLVQILLLPTSTSWSFVPILYAIGHFGLDSGVCIVRTILRVPSGISVSE